MAVIGYLEGTDPDLLSELCARGHETLPLGNGVDGHGKYIAHLTKNDGVSVVIAYYHKLTPVSGMSIEVDDLLYGCVSHDIPVLVVVPEGAKTEVQDKINVKEDLISVASNEELRSKLSTILS